MIAPPEINPSKNGGWSNESLSMFVVRPEVSATMIEKIIVVAPTTAVPMSTGFAVDLNVLPAPTGSSQLLRRLAVDVGALLRFHFVRGGRNMIDGGQREHRLRIVRLATVRVCGDRHRTDAEDAVCDETECYHRRRNHQRPEAQQTD